MLYTPFLHGRRHHLFHLLLNLGVLTNVVVRITPPSRRRHRPDPPRIVSIPSPRRPGMCLPYSGNIGSKYLAPPPTSYVACGASFPDTTTTSSEVKKERPASIVYSYVETSGIGFSAFVKRCSVQPRRYRHRIQQNIIISCIPLQPPLRRSIRTLLSPVRFSLSFVLFFLYITFNSL